MINTYSEEPTTGGGNIFSTTSQGIDNVDIVPYYYLSHKKRAPKYGLAQFWGSSSSTAKIEFEDIVRSAFVLTSMMSFIPPRRLNINEAKALAIGILLQAEKERIGVADLEAEKEIDMEI
jgi:hypothetical protein